MVYIQQTPNHHYQKIILPNILCAFYLSIIVSTCCNIIYTNTFIISSFALHHLKACYILQFSSSRNLLSLSSPPGFYTSIHMPSCLKSPRFTTSVLYAIPDSLLLSLFNVSRETIQQQLRVVMAWYSRPWCRILHNALLKTRSNCHN